MPFQRGNVWRPNIIKHCLVSKHADVEASGQTIKTCLMKHRMKLHRKELWATNYLYNRALNQGFSSRTRLSSVLFRSVEHPLLFHRLHYIYKIDIPMAGLELL